MSDAGKFTCAGCSKTYAWKPELAGKKVRCKCGQVMSVPKARAPEADLDGPPELDDLYEIAGEREEKARRTPQTTSAGELRCPSCQSEVEPGAVLCMACGMNFKTGKKMKTTVGGPDLGPPAPVLARPQLAGVAMGAAAAVPRVAGVPGVPGVPGAGRTLGYAGRNPKAAQKEAEDSQAAMKQLMWPIIMSLLGVAAMFTNMMVSYKASVPAAMAAVGVALLVNMVLISAGCLIAMKLLDFGLGAPGEALLKLCAVELLPGAVSGLIEHQLGMVGGLVGWGVALFMYYGLLMWFFDLDTMEVMILTTIIWLIRTWLGYIIVAFLLSAILGGAAWNTGAGPMALLTGGGGPSIKTDNSPAGRNNVYGEALINRRDALTSDEFLAKGPNITIMGRTFEQTKSVFDDLEAAGAGEMWVSQVRTLNDGGLAADKVVVELPEEPETRRKIFGLWHDYFANRDIGAPKDFGPDQAYLILNFDGAPD